MSISTTFIIALSISASFMLIAIISAALFRRHELKLCDKVSARRQAMITPFHIFLVGFFLAATAFIFPICHIESTEVAFVKELKSILISAHTTIRLFVVDIDYSLFSDVINESNITSPTLLSILSVYATALLIIAPVLTASFLLSFFKSASAFLRYLIYPAADLYIISELNDQSLTLAEDIMTDETLTRRRLIVFANVFSREEEECFELVTRARRVGAICFKKDITEISLRPLTGKIKRSIYFMSQNEDENVEQALHMISNCVSHKVYNTPETSFYVFANTAASEVLLNSADNGNMRMRRVRQDRNLAIDLLRTHSIFADAKDVGDEKHIGIVIIGLGGHGRELLKAAVWCAQMPGYKLDVHVFDGDPDVAERMACMAPDLIKYNNLSMEGEPYYNIHFYGGIDVKSAKFLNELSKIETVTTVYITLGDDELDISTAIEVRAQLGRNAVDFGRKVPPIFAVVYDPLKNETFSHNGGLKSFRGKEYGIEFVGDMSRIFSRAFIEQDKLEREGLMHHCGWSQAHVDDPEHEDEQTRQNRALYEKYEYYRKASTASAIYAEFRKELGLVGGISPELDRLLGMYEHNRWTAFMRTEGYVGRKSDRDDVSKVHPDLVVYADLSDAEKRKDDIMIGLDKSK